MNGKPSGLRGDQARYGVVRDVKCVRVRTSVAYPFDRWLRKETQVLLRGRDYGLESRKMAQQIRNYACDHGIDVSFKCKKHAISITVWDHIAPFSRRKKS